MNGYKRRLTMALCFSLFLPVGSFARSSYNGPENLSFLKERLIKYHDTGAYYHDISGVTQRALYYLKFRINQNNRLAHPKQLAVVFDIDETSLSNYDDMLYLDFGGTEHNIEALQSDAHDPPIPYTRTLYTYAKDHGISVFFVTGRSEHLRKITEKNLLEDGYTEWAGLFMKPDDYTSKSIAPYKTAMRKRIVGMGYDIVFNIGDQESDLKGGYADMAFKLPDPFYFVS